MKGKIRKISIGDKVTIEIEVHQNDLPHVTNLLREYELVNLIGDGYGRENPPVLEIKEA